MSTRDLPLLVSLHLPKTAGTSFRIALRQHFGDALREDYAAPPMQAPRGQREWQALRGVAHARRSLRGARAVHGHFLPVRYRLATFGRPVHYLTWLRDPVERVVSHYHYWRRDYAGEDPAQPLRNRMLREAWSLERFCLGPELRDVYRQYLWGFSPRRFDFIGITEHYADDLLRMARRFPTLQLSRLHALGNPERPASRYVLAPGLRERIASHHAADMRLYAWALERRRLDAPAGPARGG